MIEAFRGIEEGVEYVNKHVKGVHVSLGDKVHFEVKAHLLVDHDPDGTVWKEVMAVPDRRGEPADNQAICFDVCIEEEIGNAGRDQAW